MNMLVFVVVVFLVQKSTWNCVHTTRVDSEWQDLLEQLVESLAIEGRTILGIFFMAVQRPSFATCYCDIFAPFVHVHKLDSPVVFRRHIPGVCV